MQTEETIELKDQSISVAEGVRKRLESDIKNKKSTRLTNFDNSDFESEPPVQELPPAIIQPLPSTSGKVTKSQAARSNNMSNNITEEENAPQNASFNPSLEGLYKPYTQKKNQTHILQDQSKPTSFISTSSSSLSDGNTCTEETVLVLEVTNIKNIKTSKKEDHSKSTTSANIVDLSKYNMENNDDQRSHSSEMLPDPTITPNKQNDNKKHFLTSTPKNVPKSESSSEEKRKREKLLSPQAIDVPMTSRQINEEVKKISPCVDLSPGKEYSTMEIRKRIDEGLLDEDVRDMMVNFYKQLYSKIKLITEMCEEYENILEQSTQPDEFQEVARLLMPQLRQLLASLRRRC